MKKNSINDSVFTYVDSVMQNSVAFWGTAVVLKYLSLVYYLTMVCNED